MKHFSSKILIIIAILGVCIVTCPKHEEHSRTLKKEINNVIDNEISNKANNAKEKVMTFFATTLCSSISEYIIDNKLSVENYFIFSIGKVTLDGETRIVSLGILNYVFTDLN